MLAVVFMVLLSRIITLTVGPVGGLIAGPIWPGPICLRMCYWMFHKISAFLASYRPYANLLCDFSQSDASIHLYKAVQYSLFHTGLHAMVKACININQLAHAICFIHLTWLITELTSASPGNR